MENEYLKKEKTQREFNEFLDAIEKLPPEKKDCGNKEWIIKDPQLQEMQGRWLERYIKEPHLFDNNSQQDIIKFLIDGAFKTDRPMHTSSSSFPQLRKTIASYADDHLRLAFMKLDGKHIDLITALAEKIPASKIVGKFYNEEFDTKTIKQDYQNELEKNVDVHQISYSHLHPAIRQFNETNTIFQPTLKNKWKNIASILAEKAPPEQLHNFFDNYKGYPGFRKYSDPSNNPIAAKYDSIKSQFEDRETISTSGKQPVNNDSRQQEGYRSNQRNFNTYKPAVNEQAPNDNIGNQGRSNDDGLTPMHVAGAAIIANAVIHSDRNAGHSVGQVTESSRHESHVEGGHSRGGSDNSSFGSRDD